MGKMKAVAAEHKAAVAAAKDVALVVFGRDERGKPHASAFTAEDQALAERAAGLMSMRVLRVATDEHRAVASELPAGRVFASGKGFVPFVAEGTHARLEAFPEAFQPAEPAYAGPMTHLSVPATWADIGVGALVLASEGLENGYFEAVVEAAIGDDRFELRWKFWPHLPPLVRGREHLALLTPAAAVLLDSQDEPTADEAPTAGA